MMQLWTAPVQSYPPLYVYLAPPLLSMLNCIRCAYDTVRARLQTEVLSHR